MAEIARLFKVSQQTVRRT
nr:hypothetical protein [Paracoccus mutanolyticus]